MALTPTDIAALSRLLDEALALDPDQREAWLSALPAEHQAHADRLREMLAQEAGLDTDERLSALPRLAGDEATARVGDRIGPYRLLREIGRGGMGSVWLAERADGAYQRKLALKLPRLAWGAGLAERMAREREIGMLLEHPNIARLYDAGVDERGRPFLALEFVDGQPIDAWCEAKGLNVRERLRLFMQVAKAVAYAHGRLVVHRDLKPSNVLVSADGQAHLLDFGIAKLLSDVAPDEPGLTQQQGRVMTPHYASPEQVAGEAITVQSDVYSLGVLLYELLTGTLPIAPKRGTLGAVEEAILEGDAPLASGRVKDKATARALRGEVDAILAKAMQREPGRRYSTADALALDIERNLHGETVSARPDSWGYRLRKAARRHWVGVSATAAVAVAVLTGSGVAVVQAQRANTEAERAQLVRSFVLDLFDAAGGSQGQMPAQELLEKGARSIDSRFPGQPLLQSDLYGAVAQMFAKVGNVDRSIEYRARQIENMVVAGVASRDIAVATLGAAEAIFSAYRFAEAGVRFRRALELAGEDHDLRARIHAGLAHTMMEGVGKRKVDAGRELDAAEADAARPGVLPTTRAIVLTTRGVWFADGGDVDRSLPLFDEAVRMGLAAQGALSRQAMDARTSAAARLVRAARGEEAKRYLYPALAAMRAAGGADDAKAAFEELTQTAGLYDIGAVAWDDARDALERCFEILLSRMWVPAASDMWIAARVSEVYFVAGDVVRANALISRALAVPPREGTSRRDWWRHHLLAMAAGWSGRTAEAEREARAAVAWSKARDDRDALEDSNIALGQTLLLDRRYGEAEAVIAEIDALATQSNVPTPSAGTWQDLDILRAWVRLERGKPEPVIAMVDSWTLNASDRRDDLPRLLRASALCAVGRNVQGLGEFERWLPEVSKQSYAASPNVAHWRARMGLCALQAGRKQQAREAAALASAAIAEQPAVSAHFKAPVLELERRLRQG